MDTIVNIAKETKRQYIIESQSKRKPCFICDSDFNLIRFPILNN